MRPSLNKLELIQTRCTTECKEQLARKLISIGYSYKRSGRLEPSLADFMEALASKSPEWFEANFGKVIDTIR